MPNTAIPLHSGKLKIAFPTHWLVESYIIQIHFIVITSKTKVAQWNWNTKTHTCNQFILYLYCRLMSRACWQYKKHWSVFSSLPLSQTVTVFQHHVQSSAKVLSLSGKWVNIYSKYYTDSFELLKHAQIVLFQYSCTEWRLVFATFEQEK